MPPPLKERNTKALWGLILVAIAIGIIYRIWPLLTGNPELDGLLAIALGFYVCSRAAANFLNLLLYELHVRRWSSLTRSDISWLGLNALVMLSGLSFLPLFSFELRTFNTQTNAPIKNAMMKINIIIPKITE